MVKMKVPSGQLDDADSGSNVVILLGKHEKNRNFERCCKQSLAGFLWNILMSVVSNNLSKNLQSQVFSLKSFLLLLQILDQDLKYISDTDL